MQAPSSPGVYWFLDDQKNVLYVGKAKHLKKRLTSYTHEVRLSSRIKQMVASATQVQYQVLENELEALLVEAELVRSYQPHYNILLKDDKSELYILITKEPFPRVLQVRKKELPTIDQKGTSIGPFQSAYRVREVLKIVRPIFPWCNAPRNTSRACFYRHIELCPGVCTHSIDQESYQENIKDLTTFLRGKTRSITRQLQHELREAIKAQEFEHAAQLRDQLQLIEEVTQPSYQLKPQLTTPSLVSDAEHGLKQLRSVLRDHLFLPKHYPLHRIEAYDVSNISGTNPAVAMVTAIEGIMKPAKYRLFNIRTLNTPNDYQMMKEALARRQNHPEWGIPDLVVIDGGKGQLRAALSVWQWDTPVISIAKNPDRLIIPKLNWPAVAAQPTEERNLTKHLEYYQLTLPETHKGLRLIQQTRDEAHRFSKKQHAKRREKEMLGLL
ncbi:MAG: GIY-YIG nuclease family protein [Pseudomonadales bacterium]|nr:GIY-YIG nuclease family protein [Candidatus Woesebacteria bacterium]MCB9802380.1 GIY-YIG nuclease family protein [Pseudomonadales bacterium]